MDCLGLVTHRYECLPYTVQYVNDDGSIDVNDNGEFLEVSDSEYEAASQDDNDSSEYESEDEMNS